MNREQVEQNKNIFISNSVEAFIRIGALLLLAIWCFDIAKPFLIMIIWGVIIAVASYPLYAKLCELLSGHHVLASLVFTLTLLGIIFVPTILLSTTAIESATNLAQQLNAGELVIPQPGETVKNWPLIGPEVSDLWSLASNNISAAFEQIQPQLKSVGLWLLQMAKSAGLGLLTSLVAIILAGFFLANAKNGQRFARLFALRIMGQQGENYVQLAGKIIQSVTQGILGLSIIQSLLAGLGFLVMGVPAAGLWAFLCLILGIVQIGAMPVILGVAIYVFSTVDTFAGIVFLLWSLAIGLIDNIFKPILFSRGVNVPTAVIFVGAIGGLLSMGIIGLFLGAVVLALSHSLFLMWLSEEKQEKVKS